MTSLDTSSLHVNDAKRNSPPVHVTSFTQSQKCCSRMNLSKYGLFVVNFFVWAAGGILIGVGVWYHLKQDTAASAFDDVTVDMAYLLIGIGAVMFVVGLFGCLGALRESLCLLKVFVVAVVAVFVVQMVAGVLAFVMLDTVEASILSLLQDTVVHYNATGQPSDMDRALDTLQAEYKCCGGSSYEDWKDSAYVYNCSSSSSSLACDVPDSCCFSPTPGCGDKVLYYPEQFARVKIHTRGCIGALLNIFKENLIIVGLIAFAVGFLQVCSLIMAHCLMRYIMADDKLAF